MTLERPASGERVILVHVRTDSFGVVHRPVLTDADISEFEALARAAGANVVSQLLVHRTAPDSKYFLGSGKVADLKSLVQETNAELVIFNAPISPTQERNIEITIECRVLDRTGLILDIFAQRARTFEGKLQVEWAQLKHASTRLVRGWTHLERQRGGIGLRGGPGETQLEIDRRLIRGRLQKIMAQLEKIRSQREASRQKRQKNNVPTIALVGYTNAGKSTLFNYLTHAAVYVENQLFATLDPTMRAIELSSIGKVILADTVGFIRNLPHELVEAFKATLEETRGADLLLHVIDSHDPDFRAHKQAVESVLIDIGADQIPMIEVYNKIDLNRNQDTEPALEASIPAASAAFEYKAWVSAQTGFGISELKEKIVKQLTPNKISGTLVLSCDFLESPKIRDFLYQHSAILNEKLDKSGNWVLDISIREQDWDRACSKFKKLTSYFSVRPNP